MTARSSHPVDQVTDHFRHALGRIPGLLHDRRRYALRASNRRLPPRTLATT
ncbi:MAG TPA: hypothetical protein VJ650_01825 [Gemmatimonadaceae bacterium]|nr:hypothetical protein [Gemmatimonadaceae bacterium]